MIKTAAGGAQGGVCLVVWEKPRGWSLEYIRFHGPNLVICEVVNDRKWTLIIGTYLPPYTLEKLMDLEEDLAHFRDQYTIVLGGLSSDIGKSQNPRRQQVADLLSG